MSEPIWNPAFEPGHDDQADLTDIQGQSPASHLSRILLPGQEQDECLPAQAPSAGSSLFVSHPATTVPAGPLLFPQGHLSKLEPDEPDEEDPQPDPEPEPVQEADEEAKMADKSEESEDETAAEDEAPAKAGLVSRLMPLLRASGFAGVQGWQLARHYPRAALGSGLSVLILASVMILQPGKGKHDTTAQINGSAGADQAQHKSAEDKSEKQKQTETKPQQTETPASDPAAPVVGKTDAHAPQMSVTNDRPTFTAAAHSPTQDLLESSPAKPAPPPLADSHADKDLAAANHPVLAPAPAAIGSEMPPLPGEEPVKLTAGERFAPLPTIEGPPLKPPDGKDAAPPPPLMELAAADLKPGTPPAGAPLRAPAPVPLPSTAPAPAPTTGPALAPAPAPAPVKTPAPAATLATAPSPAPAPSPAVHPPDVKNAKPGAAQPATPATPVKAPVPAPVPVPAAHGAGATTAAAVAAGSVGLAVGTGLGAAVSALTRGGDKHKDQPKVEVKPEAAKPAVAPAPVASTPVLPPTQPVESRPAAIVAAPHAEPPKASPAPVPHEPIQAKAEQMPLPVPLPSQHEPPPASAELPPLHPVTDLAVPAREHGLDAPIPAAPPRHDPPASLAREPVPASTKADLAKEGWVPLKHSAGPALQDVEREASGFDDGPVAGRGGVTSSEPGELASDRQSFDLETPRSNPAELAGTVPGKKSSRQDGKLDTVLYPVEGKENFWDISRMYYNSGRYYKALWAANIDKVPQIDKLYRGTVIRIPPIEDLDPAYIDPASSRTRRPAEGDIATREADPGEAEPSRSNIEHTASRQAGSGDGVPIRRSSRADSELNLPVSDVASDETAGGRQSSRGVHRAVVDDAEPEYRARDAVTRPIYKVRQYDTLRTIARDTLGDSHRASEILELNREIIDDPRHLIVGQILELPEDARPARTRTRR